MQLFLAVGSILEMFESDLLIPPNTSAVPILINCNSTSLTHYYILLNCVMSVFSLNSYCIVLYCIVIRTELSQYDFEGQCVSESGILFDLLQRCIGSRQLK